MGGNNVGTKSAKGDNTENHKNTKVIIREGGTSNLNICLRFFVLGGPYKEIHRYTGSQVL